MGKCGRCKMRLKWVRRDFVDPNTILCIYDDANRPVYIDLDQVEELHQFIHNRNGD